jgi:hypothetical protein
VRSAWWASTTPRPAELALLEQLPDFRRGAVSVFREAFDDDGNFRGRKTLVRHQFISYIFIQQAGALLDCPLDGVAGHGLLFGGLDRGPKTGVVLRLRIPELGRHEDFLDKLAD